MSAASPNIYEREARLRRVLALDAALDLTLAELRGRDVDAYFSVQSSVASLATWSAESRATFARAAGIATPPSDATWAELVAHRASKVVA